MSSAVVVLSPVTSPRYSSLPVITALGTAPDLRGSFFGTSRFGTLCASRPVAVAETDDAFTRTSRIACSHVGKIGNEDVGAAVGHLAVEQMHHVIRINSDAEARKDDLLSLERITHGFHREAVLITAGVLVRDIVLWVTEAVSGCVTAPHNDVQILWAPLEVLSALHQPSKHILGSIVAAHGLHLAEVAAEQGQVLCQRRLLEARVVVVVAIHLIPNAHVEAAELLQRGNDAVDGVLELVHDATHVHR
jgi:hypothetical protein